MVTEEEVGAEQEREKNTAKGDHERVQEDGNAANKQKETERRNTEQDHEAREQQNENNRE